MKYHIENSDAGLSIRIDEMAGQEQALLEAIRQCRQSAWACPSGECMNIGTIEEHTEDGSVFLTLTARPGVQLSAIGIGECLGYMLAQAVKS
ncbi:MAG: hypothetical protein WA373_13415 [Burkholderiales bacterium]